MQYISLILILQRILIISLFVLITNYKDSFWHVEYNDGDKEDFDVNELMKCLQLYNSAKEGIFVYFRQ